MNDVKASTGAVLCVAIIVACVKQAPPAGPAAGGPPAAIVGQWDDDYGGRHTVSATEWMQGRARYRIVRWDTTRHFLVAQNDTANRADGGKWTRIDWVMLPGMTPWEWAFCFSAYDAPTRAAAETTSVARPATPRTGCNGFPFSRLKRAPR